MRTETQTVDQSPRWIPAFAGTNVPRPGSSLGLKANAIDELIRQLEEGLSFQGLERLASQSGLAVTMLAGLIGIPYRTLARRKASGKLSPDESERLLRISMNFERAVHLFEGNVENAVRWLSTKRKALGGRTPLDYSRTELGAREVEDLIGRLEHGVFS